MYNCPAKLKEKAYNTLVLPRLEYCASVWDPHTKCSIHNLEKIHKKGARFVLNKPHRKILQAQQIGGATLVSKLNWNTLESRRKNLRLINFYKMVNQKIAIPLAYLPKTAIRTTSHHNKQGFLIPHSNSDAFKYSLIPRTTTDWNKLPHETTCCTTTDSFKRLIPS